MQSKEYDKLKKQIATLRLEIEDLRDALTDKINLVHDEIENIAEDVAEDKADEVATTICDEIKDHLRNI